MLKTRKPPVPVPFDKPLVKPRVPELSLILDNDNQGSGAHLHKPDGNGTSTQYYVPHDSRENVVEYQKAGSNMKPFGSHDIQTSQDVNSYHAWRMKHKLFLPSETEGNKDSGESIIDSRPKLANALHATSAAQVNTEGKLDCSTSCEFDSDDYENYAADSAKNYMHFLESSLREKYNKEQKETAFRNMQEKNMRCRTSDLSANVIAQHGEEQLQSKQFLYHSSGNHVAEANLASNEELVAKRATLFNDCTKQYGENIAEGASRSPCQAEMPQAVLQKVVTDGALDVGTRREYISSDTHLESNRSLPLQINEFSNSFNQHQMYQEKYGTVNSNFKHKITSLHHHPKLPSVNKVQIIREENEASLKLPPGGLHILENIPSGHQELGSGSQAVKSYLPASGLAQFNPHVHHETVDPSWVKPVNREEHDMRMVGGTFQQHLDVTGGSCVMSHKEQQHVTTRNQVFTSRAAGPTNNVVPKHATGELDKKIISCLQNACRSVQFNPDVHHETIDPSQLKTVDREYGGVHRMVRDGVPQNTEVLGGSCTVPHEGPQLVTSKNLEFTNRTVGFSRKDVVAEHSKERLEKKTVIPCTGFASYRNVKLNSEPTNHVALPNGQCPALNGCSCETTPSRCEHTGNSRSSQKACKMTRCQNENLARTRGYVVQKYVNNEGEMLNTCTSRKQMHGDENVCELCSCRGVLPFSTVKNKQEEIGDNGCERTAARRCGHQYGCGHACTVVPPKCSDPSSAVDKAMLLTMMDMMKWQSRQIQMLQDQLGGLAAHRYKDGNRNLANKAIQTCPGQLTVSVGVGTVQACDRLPLMGAQGEVRQAVQSDPVHKRCEHCSPNPPRPAPSVDESLTLHDLDLLNVPEPSVSPVSSVHVDIRDCCELTDDESPSVQPGNMEPHYLHTQGQQENCVGWTFYNNVVGQVNKMLDASPPADAVKTHPGGCCDAASPTRMHQASVEQLHKLDINRVTFEPGFSPWMDRRAVNKSNESESSLRMRALAMKYGKDDQLNEFPRISAGGLKAPERLQDITFYGMATQTTNLSFATLRYLERYHLIPTTGNANGGNMVPGMNPYLEPKPTASSQQTHSPANGSCKILDITTLRQQPKLL